MSLILPVIPVDVEDSLSQTQRYVSESKDHVDVSLGELKKIFDHSEAVYQLTEKDSAEIAKNFEKNKELNKPIAYLDRESGPIEYIVDGKVFTLEFKDTSTVGSWPFLVITDHESGRKKNLLKAEIDANGVLSWINSDMAKIEEYRQPLEGLEKIEICHREVTIEISIIAPDGSINGGSLIFRRELFDRLFNEEIYETGKQKVDFEMKDVRDKNLEKAIAIKFKDSNRFTRNGYILAIKKGVYGASLVFEDFTEEETTNE